jgi:hypothetical protein
MTRSIEKIEHDLETMHRCLEYWNSVDEFQPDAELAKRNIEILNQFILEDNKELNKLKILV